MDWIAQRDRWMKEGGEVMQTVAMISSEIEKTGVQ